MILPTNNQTKKAQAGANSFVQKLLNQEYTKEMKEEKIEAFGAPQAKKE